MPHLKNRIAACILGLGLALWPLSLPAGAQPDVVTPERPPQLPTHAYVSQLLYASPDGRYAARVARTLVFGPGMTRYAQAGAQVSLWEVGSGRLLWQKSSQANAYAFGCFSPDSKRFMVYGGYVRQEENKIVERSNRCDIWDIDGQHNLSTLEQANPEMLRFLIFSPDGQTLIGQTHTSQKQADGKIVPVFHVKVWDAKTGALLRTVDDQPELNQSAMWAADARYLATYTQYVHKEGNNGNGLYLWSLPDLRLYRSYMTGEKLTTLAVFSPDGRKAAFRVNKRSANEAATDEVYLWDLEADTTIRVADPQTPRYRVHGLAFSPDGQTLVAAGALAENWGNSALELWSWNVRDGALQRTVFQDESTDTYVSVSQRICFLPDGKHFLADRNKGKVELRRLEDGALVRVFE